jgi:hypothetical protein
MLRYGRALWRDCSGAGRNCAVGSRVRSARVLSAWPSPPIRCTECGRWLQTARAAPQSVSHLKARLHLWYRPSVNFDARRYSFRLITLIIVAGALLLLVACPPSRTLPDSPLPEEVWVLPMEMTEPELAGRLPSRGSVYGDFELKHRVFINCDLEWHRRDHAWLLVYRGRSMLDILRTDPGSGELVGGYREAPGQRGNPDHSGLRLLRVDPK